MSIKSSYMWEKNLTSSWSHLCSYNVLLLWTFELCFQRYVPNEAAEGEGNVIWLCAFVESSKLQG